MKAFEKIIVMKYVENTQKTHLYFLVYSVNNFYDKRSVNDI